MSITIDYNAILNYLLTANMQRTWLWVQLVFFVVSLILLIAIVILMMKTHYLQWLFMNNLLEFLTFRPAGAKKITKTWNKIKSRLDAGQESEYKLAVVEADDMLDASLRRMGYLGQSLEERLGKLTSATVGNLDDVYTAHKVRNSIIRDPNFRLSQDEAKITIETYQKAFNSLQIIT